MSTTHMIIEEDLLRLSYLLVHKMFKLSLNRILSVRPIYVTTNYCKRFLSVDNNVEKIDSNVGGFAESYKKFENINKSSDEEPKTFSSLLKNSKFIDVNIYFN